MTEKTLFETEQVMSSKEISEYLHMIADKIGEEQVISLKSNGQEVDLDTHGRKEFEIKVEEETSDSGEETSLELEIEWKQPENREESGLEIE
jgi:amphi-Trp domain-containing protein